MRWLYLRHDSQLHQDAMASQAAPAADPVYLTRGNDEFVGTSGNDEVHGRGGDDIILGRRGHDTLRGGQGNDILDGEGGGDRLYGGFGNDDLVGAGQHDLLRGGTGDDSLHGGSGKDTLQGGLGSDRLDPEREDGAVDRLIYVTVDDSSFAFGIDTVDNFAFGEDLVDLHRIDADATTAADDAFHWIGKAEFTGTAGELRYEHFQSGSIEGDNLLGDIDGDGQADLVIQFIIFSPGHIADTDIVL